eukprot:974701_1
MGVVRFIVFCILYVHGAFDEMGTDNGREFRNRVLVLLAFVLGVKHSFSIPYSPWVQGCVESKMKGINKQKRILDIHCRLLQDEIVAKGLGLDSFRMRLLDNLECDVDRISDQLRIMVLKHNMDRKELTGCSPNELRLMAMRSPIDAAFGIAAFIKLDRKQFKDGRTYANYQEFYRFAKQQYKLLLDKAQRRKFKKNVKVNLMKEDGKSMQIVEGNWVILKVEMTGNKKVNFEVGWRVIEVDLDQVKPIYVIKHVASDEIKRVNRGRILPFVRPIFSKGYAVAMQGDVARLAEAELKEEERLQGREDGNVNEDINKKYLLAMMEPMQHLKSIKLTSAIHVHRGSFLIFGMYCGAKD